MMTAQRASKHIPQVIFFLPDGTETEEQLNLHIAEVGERIHNVKGTYEMVEGPGTWGLPDPATELSDWI